ncbi:adenylate kinase [Acinetobacter defluvii]|uniref:Adenylate kinase n=1 Tax=Acinetobacter defluvii TaxID=1871111 RepID=A0A2S2FGQ8_9GAMM|nr:shikimate kinase [Acinetobacter defluvii]AWL29975.1 adenylate kinase [Acinetobacter defluvii]
MQRINVVGTSASGKSTFARQLAQKLNLAYIELDDLLWLDNWQETPDAEFFQKIKDAMVQSSDGYVIDGNYTRTVPLTWQEIDTVIWLDLPFYLNLYQSIKRALSRAISKQPFWENSNNTESFKQMLSRDSIILWMIKTHKKNRKKYQARIKNSEYAHI